MKDAALKPALALGPAPRAGVLLPFPLPGPYDYKLPSGMEVSRGLLVTAPLGPRESLGVVWGEAEGAVGDNRLRLAVPLEGEPVLPADLCDFVDWVADYTLTPKGLVLAMALRSRQALMAESPRTAYALGPALPAKLTLPRRRIADLMKDGLVRSAASIAEEANVGAGVVRGLIAAGALVPVAMPEFAPVPRPDADFARAVLSLDQEAAARSLKAQIASRRFAVSLLDGVTGSGKTETYFEAVAEALRQNRQVLILLPEIALTVQFLDRFSERFGVRPAEWHSDLSQRERRRIWRAVLRGEARVVVGARSALFLPFAELGLVVVDEEHEQAYKQEEGPIYHARDMAVVRARLAKCPVVLASATPSLESYVNATGGRYAHLKLPRRHNNATMPEVRLVDLTRERGEPGTFLSPPLRDALARTLGAGEQAMLFLNRRGYAPLTLCEACGHKMTCPHCAAWLVEHRYRSRLICHHCGFDTAVPAHCPQCATPSSLIACGPGVERVAEEFALAFPTARVAIASSDTLQGPDETQAAIRAMNKRETDVLIGTQIVAKGHHFPQLTLVGVVDADLGGSDGDLRARERTFQLLHQVSGRAGRADKPGLVLIQTRNPKDAVMQALVMSDRDAFYAQERLMRERAQAPPFGRLAAIILSGVQGDAVREAGRLLARSAPAARGVKVWGPTPAFYALLRGQTRERLLVQAERSVDIQAYLRTWLGRVHLANAVRLSLDIDPVSFF
ncbi:MAG: primosomal protein N' [Alphaproteobacteria bacterium]|nr:primosomal protein N' [Alphaproteobacteria bacterium]MBV9692523.1 primosomal protein N' [Alphaproteobacteria bacterium]